MAKFEGIIFNEVQMPSFVRVININHSILPPISQNLLTIGGREGAYDFGNVIGTREISVDIAIIAPEENVMPSMLEELSAWLYYDEDKELILGDNPYRYYLAKVTGGTNIAEQFTVGSGTITFTCSDPYIYGQEREVTIPSTYTGGVLELTNTGNADALPEMSFKITKKLTNFSIVSGDEYLDFGTPYDVDNVEADVVDAGGYVAREYMETTNGWSTPTSVYGGAISGAFETYGGYAFRQSGLDYGTASGWHGASMTRLFSQETQNFEASTLCTINTYSKAGYIGTIKLKGNLNQRTGSSTKYKIKKVGKTGETYKVTSKASNGWYKLDNGYYCSNKSDYSTYTAENEGANKLGRQVFTLKDTSGNALAHGLIYDSSGSNRSLQAEFKLVRGSTTKTLFKISLPSKYHDFKGGFRIKRLGTVWEVSLYIWTGSRYTRYKFVRWIDSKKTYKAKVNDMQVAVQGYGSNPVTYMEIRDAWVKTLDIEATSDKIPLIMRAGDVLEIDNATGAILLNNHPFYEYLNPSSTFIRFQSGQNGLVISPADAFKNGTISYTERTL